MKAFFFLALIILPLIFACTYPEAEYIPYIPAPDTVNVRDTVIVHAEVEDIFDYFDPYFRYQGYLNYAGTYGLANFTRDAAIDILPAWEISKGSGVKVAVLDNYIDATHEELQNITVYNLKDGSNSSVIDYEKDVAFHGTAVSAVIAARENGIGIIGVAPECDLLSIGIDFSEYTIADEVRAFQYAADWGAKVINCSWSRYEVIPIVDNVLKECYDAGITVLFASGNDGINMDIISNKYGDLYAESESEWVIGVGASDTYGRRASFSNYGKNIDILAPGYYILTADIMGIYGDNSGDLFFDPNYTITAGTSFAAPITSGVIALMLSANPSLGVEDIKKILYETADKVPTTLGGGYDANGFSLECGHGKINAGRAVRRAAGIE